MRTKKISEQIAAKLAAEFREEQDFESRVDAIAAHMKDLRLTADDFPMIADSLDFLNDEETPSTPLPPKRQ